MLSVGRPPSSVLMKAVVAANGEMVAHARLQELWQRVDLRIAADGGARNARLFLQRAPQVVIGDFDSLDDETRLWLESKRSNGFNTRSPRTRPIWRFAVLLAKTRGADQITILGALGGRVDHLLPTSCC